ncbi:MAG: transglycosylase domain-containing protein, partial [Actinomycetota bacterium]|nr:transglycosylase domain-containing protein [Actinomycetota bacterium]
MNSFFETSKKAKRPRLSLFLRTVRFLFNLALIVAVTSVIVLVGSYWLVVGEYGERLDRRYPELAQDSYVYDVNGNKVGEFSVQESRETVGFDGFGRHLPRAVVAVEDRRFYDHLGVDPEGVARAAWTDLRAREVQEGGSTITEQLMKNLFVPEGERFEVSFRRRFVQSALAFSYERHHTKREILTSYLNTVYFGNGAYGAEMAAQRYFGKSARELTLPEAAALAGFLDAPSTYF